MKFSKWIPLFCAFYMGHAAAEIPDIGPVSEVGAGRVGDNVVRYVKIFGKSCLEVQVISPEKNWKVLSSSNFCTFEGKKFGSDFADAGFEDISVEADGIHLTLSLTPLQPTGEQRRSCVIPVVATVIKDLSCSEAGK
jgi:hypothetical protein